MRWRPSRRRPIRPRTATTSAYGYVLRKDYALAEDGFRGFVQKFPNDRRAADARFWIGESLFQRQRYEQAAQAFLELSTKHGAPCQGAGGAAPPRAIAGRDEAEGNGLRHARRGRPQVSASLRHRETGRRARAEACQVLTV